MLTRAKVSSLTIAALLVLTLAPGAPTTAAPPEPLNTLSNEATEAHFSDFSAPSASSVVQAPLTPLSPGTTTRVSVASDGSQGNDESSYPSIAADGRYMAFCSNASNLVSGDTNGVGDIFVHDRQTGQTTRVSVASDGSQGNDGSSRYPFISADGRYVTFSSSATNLVSNDTNNISDIFVHDRNTGQTTRVSVASDGSQGNNWSYESSISANGRYVLFRSSATNFVSNDMNGSSADIFVHDRETGQTTLVSVNSEGNQCEPGGTVIPEFPSMSANGRYVTFEYACSLATNDTRSGDDIFVRDRETGQTVLVSVASDGTQGNSFSFDPSISPDGRYVAFASNASNLVAGDTNNSYDVFVHDRDTSQTTCVSVASDGSQGNGVSGGPSISADGRYVPFESRASNMVSGDTNGVVDAFVHDRQTGQTIRVSVASDDSQGNGGSGASFISADGRYVAFYSRASNLVSDDTNGEPDIFVHDREGGGDTTPPAAITDLVASTGSTAGAVNLSWTAPGDDGNTGTASAYVVRYADSAIVSELGWLNATDVSGEPTPQAAGSSESMTVSGLTPGQTYYFAIRTQDEAANWSGLSNSPSAVASESPDLGFRPNPDGYGFSNPGSASSQPNCEEFKEIFSGLPIECKNGRPQEQYVQLYNKTRNVFSTGLCLGMSSTSLDYFVGGLSKPREVDTFQLTDDESWPNIAIYHGRQRSKAFTDHTVAEWSEWGPSANTSDLVDDVYQQLQAVLQPGYSDLVTVLFWPKPDHSDKGGHAVTPYRIDETAPQHPKVYIYENFSKGDSDKYIQFDLSGTSHTFSYASTFGTWNSTNRALVLAPLSIWHSDEADVPYDGWRAAKSGGGELVISGGEGQLIGYVGGVLTATIPGAMPLFPWYTPDGAAPDDLSYILPDGDYTATISGATEPYAYTMWTTGNRVLVNAGATGLQAQATDDVSGADQIAVGATGSKVALRTGDTPSRPFSVNLMRSQADVSRIYEIADTDLGTNVLFALGVGDADEFYLHNSTQETNYDLGLQMVTTNTTVIFYHPDITIGASDVQTITVTDWQQMITVTLQIDQGGDGTVDETCVLENRLSKVYLPLILRSH